MDERNQTLNITFAKTPTKRDLGAQGFNKVCIAGFEYFVHLVSSSDGFTSFGVQTLL